MSLKIIQKTKSLNIPYKTRHQSEGEKDVNSNNRINSFHLYLHTVTVVSDIHWKKELLVVIEVLQVCVAISTLPEMSR